VATERHFCTAPDGKILPIQKPGFAMTQAVDFAVLGENPNDFGD